jgi:hypothetical protein
MAFKCFPGYSYPGCINDDEGLSSICNPFTGKPQATRVLAASFIIQNLSFIIRFMGGLRVTGNLMGDAIFNRD